MNRTTKPTVHIENITLEGREFLRMEEVTTVEVINLREGKEVASAKEISRKKLSFPLAEITVEQLKALRKTTIPSFVLKENGKYFYAQINANICLMTARFMGEHKCAMNCKRLSAASDRDGGCQRIRDYRTRRIEKYPWIVVGYETFNAGDNTFSVVECNHYEMCGPRKKYNAEQMRSMKMGILSYLTDDPEGFYKKMREHR